MTTNTSKWTFDLTKGKGKASDIPNPIGLERNFVDETSVEQRPQVLKEVWEKKIKSFATSPLQQILMAFLVLYFTGGGLNIFTIFAIVSFTLQPVKGLLNINQAFRQFEGHGVPLFTYKLMYGAIQMVILGLCLNKFHGMGLLPLSPADWIDLIPHDIDTKQAFPMRS